MRYPPRRRKGRALVQKSDTNPKAPPTGGVIRRTAALLLILVGSLSAVGAGGVIWGHYADEAAKEAALAAGAPAALAIEDFRRDRDVGPFGETRLRAQILPARVVIDPAPNTRFLTPLLPTQAATANAAPIGWLTHPAAPWRADLLERFTVAAGPAGAIVEIDVRRVDARPYFQALSATREGFDMDRLVFEAFLDGREVALAPATEAPVSGAVVMLIALIVFAYGVFLWRGRRV